MLCPANIATNKNPDFRRGLFTDSNLTESSHRRVRSNSIALVHHDFDYDLHSVSKLSQPKQVVKLLFISLREVHVKWLSRMEGINEWFKALRVGNGHRDFAARS